MDSTPHSDPPADALAAASESRLRDLRDSFGSRAAERGASFQTLEDRLSAELQSIAEQVAAELESQRARESLGIEARSAELMEELDGRARELDNAHQSIESERESLAQQRADLDRQSMERLAEIESRSQQLAEQEARLSEAAQQQQLRAEELARLEAEQAAEAAQLESSYADLERLEAEIESRLAELDARSTEQAEQPVGSVGAGEAEKRIERLTGELASALAELESLSRRLEERDDQNLAAIATLETERDAARDGLARVQAESADRIRLLEAELEASRQEAERLGERLSQLEADLACCGTPDDLQAEFEQVQGERDALQTRVADLEAAASTVGPPEDDDLRRRFEMAVEDVRQLKAEKAALEAQFSQAPAPDNATDWESQKRRMLASLEGDASPERSQERATIEGTIRVTDQLVAGKDREIAELRRELESRPDPGSQPQAPPQPQAIDDASVQVELARVEALRKEWESKLREAELEMSVERARIAREQAELAEWRIELEGIADNVRHAQMPLSGGKSQSNWMRKMGLGGGDGK